MESCNHLELCTGISPCADPNHFTQPPLDKRLAATTTSGRIPKDRQFPVSEDAMSSGWTFPAPLVLPGDDLDSTSRESPQSLRSWQLLRKDTPMTSRKRTIYVVPSPEITKEVQPLMKNWKRPIVPRECRAEGIPSAVSEPKIDDLCDYLRAFYHGMHIHQLDATFSWRLWDDAPEKSSEGYIGLATPAPQEELVRIRHRPSPDGIARGQLNLSDILDALIDRVPGDAYAIVMFVDYDLYEDSDGDFCCGRAYGGSRIAIVSSFRYHPSLDDYSDIQHSHMWPASHCEAYIESLCVPIDQKIPIQSGSTNMEKDASFLPNSALAVAVEASSPVLSPKTAKDFAGLWFSRVARTISHEIGHTLILAHCAFYACIMQGTAGMSEDVRQPPYLCPVCLSKVSRALCLFMGRGLTVSLDLQRAYIRERYEALMAFCERWKHVGMFAGYQAWIEKRLEEDRKQEGKP